MARRLGGVRHVVTPPASHLPSSHQEWVADVSGWCRVDKALTYRDDRNVQLTNPSVGCTLLQTLLATCGDGHFWAIPTMEIFSVLDPPRSLLLGPQRCRRT